jgi:hypothetical protein
VNQATTPAHHRLGHLLRIAFTIEEQLAKACRDDAWGEFSPLLAHHRDNAISGSEKKREVILIKGSVEVHRLQHCAEFYP